MGHRNLPRRGAEQSVQAWRLWGCASNSESRERWRQSVRVCACVSVCVYMCARVFVSVHGCMQVHVCTRVSARV